MPGGHRTSETTVDEFTGNFAALLNISGTPVFPVLLLVKGSNTQVVISQSIFDLISRSSDRFQLFADAVSCKTPCRTSR